MSDLPTPNSIEELQRHVDSSATVLPVGNQTKPRLSSIPNVELVSLSRLSGITQYEPSEYTFTALAGTTISTVATKLAEQNQYLPFDTHWIDAGATLGGTVASGISGPQRVRYGGIRDFLLGATVCSGDGHLVRVGGKVVKNAAGFDIPKLMVGSTGRFGVLAELTFKVFPSPPQVKTYRMGVSGAVGAVNSINRLLSSRWEVNALDYWPERKEIGFQLTGSTESIIAIASDIEHQLTVQLDVENDQQRYWDSVREFSFFDPEQCVVKIPVAGKSYLAIEPWLARQESFATHLGCGGAVLWVSCPVDEMSNLEKQLVDHELSGLVVRGASPTIWLGKRPQSKMAAAVKSAMDPATRFPDFEFSAV